MPLPRLRRRPTPATPECPQREGACEPLNRVWLLEGAGDGTPRLARAYAGCTCGTRFGIGEAKERWRAHWDRADRPGPGDRLDHEALAAELAKIPEPDRRVPHAAPGVVPVGAPVIHQATDWVDPADPLVQELADHMVPVMEAAPGVGLAANQVGAALRVVALNFPALVPVVWVNPVAVTSAGEWRFTEGCLSLEVEGSHTEVVRPKTITVVADLPGGSHVVVEADEMLARVVQHELDHLEGIEYVQRVAPDSRRELDPLLTDAGVDVGLLPAV